MHINVRLRTTTNIIDMHLNFVNILYYTDI